MPKITLCPNASTLKKYLLGELDEQASLQIDSHFEDCTACAAAASEVQSEADKLTLAIRNSNEPTLDIELEPEIKELMDKIRPTFNGKADDGIDETFVSSPKQEESALDFLRPPQREDEIGRLGDYRVLEVLGSGGMGFVCLAEDMKLKRRVAIKVMRRSIAINSASKERFLREAQAAAAIDHDHIVTIYQVAEDDGVPFLAMQLLEGESLQDSLERDGAFDQMRVLQVAKQTAAGLAAAHDRGLVHRDIKPDNIFLEAETKRVKLLDFGLARTPDDADDRLTVTGAILGTPRYMAPEQAKGEEVDRRSDLFSLGSVLYHLATGVAPFNGANITSILMAVANPKPQPITEIAPTLDSEIAAMIMKLLEADREDRFDSAHELKAEISTIERRLAGATLELVPSQSLSLAQDRVDTTNHENITAPIITPETKVAATPPNVTKWLLLAGGLSALFIVAAVIALSVRTKHGVLMVEADGNFTVAVENEEVILRDKNTKEEFVVSLGENSLKPGEYEIVVKTNNGLELRGGNAVTIKRGDNEPAKISLAAATNAKPVTPTEPTTPTEPVKPTTETLADWEAAQQVLAIGGRVVGENASGGRMSVPTADDPNRDDFILAGVDVGYNDSFNDESMKALAGLRHLRSFGLFRTTVTDEGLKQIRSCNTLEHLALTHPATSQSVSTILDHSPNITMLGLNGLPINNDDLADICEHKSLVSLNFGGMDLTDDGLVSLKNLPNLIELRLQPSAITDDGVKHFQAIPNLKNVFFRTEMNDAACGHLAKIKQLEIITFYFSRITDEGASELATLPNLKQLGLFGGKISDNGVAKLLDLPKLETLDLSGCPITSKSLKLIAENETLVSLTLFQQQLSDEDLLQLEGSKLKLISMHEASVTEAGVKALQKLLPDCDIRWAPAPNATAP